MTGFSISFLVKVKITAQFSQFKTIFSSVKFIPAFQCRWCFLHLQDYVISISCNMCACATCLPVDSCACCTVQFTDVARQKKSIICQQVQHNFKQYITRLKKKLKLGQQEKNNYFSLKCAKSTEIWAYICWYRSRLRYEFVRERLFTPFVTHQLCGWLNTSK